MIGGSKVAGAPITGGVSEDPYELRATLDSAGLQLVGGFIAVVLHGAPPEGRRIGSATLRQRRR
jgi:hypothetical protein